MSETEPEHSAPGSNKSALEELARREFDIVLLFVQQLDSLKTLNLLVQSHRIFHDAFLCAPYGILKAIVLRSFPKEALYCLSLARQHSLGGYARKHYIKDVGFLGEKDLTLLPLPKCRSSPSSERGSRASSPNNIASLKVPARTAGPDEWVPNKFIVVEHEKIGIPEARWLVKADREVERVALACIRHLNNGSEEMSEQLQVVKTRLYVLYRLMAQFCWVTGESAHKGENRVHGVYDYTLAAQLDGKQLQPLITLAETLPRVTEGRFHCPIAELLKDLQMDYNNTQTCKNDFSLLHKLDEIKDDATVIPTTEHESEPQVPTIPWPLVYFSTPHHNTKWEMRQYYEIRGRKDKPRETEILVRDPPRCWKPTVVRSRGRDQERRREGRLERGERRRQRRQEGYNSNPLPTPAQAPTAQAPAAPEDGDHLVADEN